MAVRTVKRTARKAARKTARTSRSKKTIRARTARRTATRRTATRRVSARKVPARAREIRAARREILVVKKDGRRENFDRDKLRRSIEGAAERTNIDRNRARELAERVAERIERDAKDAMPTTEIRERLLRELDREEKVIADEFRSHRRFGF